MLFILVLALLFFGPKELPKLARTIGKAMTEFRRAQNELKTTFNREMENLERESGVRELSNTTYLESYNYEDYGESYYDGSSDSSHSVTYDGSASAIEGAEHIPGPLQIEAPAESVPVGTVHAEAQPAAEHHDHSDTHDGHRAEAPVIG